MGGLQNAGFHIVQGYSIVNCKIMKKEGWLTLAMKLGHCNILKRYERQTLAKLNMLYGSVWRSYLSQSDFLHLSFIRSLLSQKMILQKWSVCITLRCNALLRELKPEPETSWSYWSARSFGCLAMLITFSSEAFVDWESTCFPSAETSRYVSSCV